MIQLHNQPSAELISRLSLPVLPVMRSAPGEHVSSVIEYFDSVRSEGVRAVLLDAYHPTLAGGTGLLADWDLAAAAAFSVAARFILEGTIPFPIWSSETGEGSLSGLFRSQPVSSGHC